MKSPCSPLWFALALSLVPGSVSAAEPPLVLWARQRVQEGLVSRLAEARSSKFSRARPAPLARRVRILETTTTLDKERHAFVPFAVDVQFGSDWREDIRGCVYEGSGDLFVKIGDSYRPAVFLLGKRVEPVTGVCTAAPSARA